MSAEIVSLVCNRPPMPAALRELARDIAEQLKPLDQASRLGVALYLVGEIIRGLPERLQSETSVDSIMALTADLPIA